MSQRSLVKSLSLSFFVSCPPANNYRYNDKGFVEELPKLLEKRSGYACAALPDTGVSPVKLTL